MAHLLSVNVGLPNDIAWRGETVRTAITRQRRLRDTKMRRSLVTSGSKVVMSATLRSNDRNIE